MKKGLFVVFLFWSAGLWAQFPSAKTILQRVDQNMLSRTRVVESTMIVHSRRGKRTIRARTWAEGQDKAFTEYLAPAREKGTKMLRLDNHLWLYSPQADRVIQISGHMLRQSVMGSDLSYEDLMENPRLTEIYDARVVGRDTLYGRPCWVLQLKAKKKDVAYASRKIWVDATRYVVRREERFAKSGRLLKTVDVPEVFRVEGRWYPKKVIFKDVLKTGKGTEFIVNKIQFDVKIPSYRFTKAALQR